MSWKRWILVGVLAVVVGAAVLVWANLNVAPPPTGYSSRTEAVAYYPACGNEILEYGGRTWYPIDRDEWPVPSAEASGASGSNAGHGVGGHGLGAARVPLVAAPGPGDDVGTLYVYRDGTAYWRSDSGNLDTWLTLVPHVYNWVC